MKEINKFTTGEGNVAIVLCEFKRGNNKVYRIDVTDNKEHESKYYYEFRVKQAAEDFFDSMMRHVYLRG